MHHYEIATLTLPFGTAAQAAAGVETYARAPDAQGELLGCWFTDIGVLNQLIVLRGFADLAALNAERERALRSDDAFGCAKTALGLKLESYRGFEWMQPVRPSSESGIAGPVYEIRTYGLKPGGVQATSDLWKQYLPARQERSPCVAAMVALDGPLRFTNIWAYPTIEARAKARADAVADGIWPPKGGPAWLDAAAMVSTIALATKVSPLK